MSNLCRMAPMYRGEAFVDDKKVSEAELVFSVKNE